MGKQTEVMTFPYLASKRPQPVWLGDSATQRFLMNFEVKMKSLAMTVLNNFPVTPSSPVAKTGFVYGGGRNLFWRSFSSCPPRISPFLHPLRISGGMFE